MENQILLSVPFEEFEKHQKNWIKEAVNEIKAELQSTFQIDEHWTRKQTAKYLKISLVTLNNYKNTGRLKSYRVNGRVLYKIEEVKSALK